MSPTPTPCKAVFFDRDGVLNVDTDYLFRIEEFQWVKGAVEAVCRLNAKGYRIFVVTNQSGIARGYFTENDLRALHAHMSFELAQHGGHIDAFAFCPHHPEKAVEMRYRLDCACRKPRPGMLLDLIERFAVDRKESFLIGDKQSDIRAAEAAGVDGYLFDSGNTGGDLAAFLSGVLNQRSA